MKKGWDNYTPIDTFKEKGRDSSNRKFSFKKCREPQNKG